MKTVIIYRALKLNTSARDITKIGIYWTLDHNQAFPYGYKQQIDDYYIYTAKIPNNCIDIAATAIKADGTFSYEKEVVLKPNEEIQVIRIEHIKLFAPMQHNKDWIFKKEIQLININFKVIT